MDSISIVCDGTAFVPLSASLIIIRVFITPGSNQSIPFTSSIPYCKGLAGKNHIIEYCNVDDLKNGTYKWTPDDLVEWLLRSHIHIIATHPNQGQRHWRHCTRWKFVDLQRALMRLSHHNGFPNGDNLQCPMFTQDKIVYIHAVPHICNQTLKIDLVENFQVSSSVIDKIKMFCEENTDEGCGYILKAPFVTSGEKRRWPKTYENVLEELHSLTNEKNRLHEIFPYYMLQAKMRNTKEMKILCLNGEAKGIVKHDNTSGIKFTESNRSKLFSFAEHAVQELKLACPAAICHGIVRVDLFEDVHGNLRVNEYESLEAAYQTTGRTNTQDSQTLWFSVCFWVETIDTCLSKL